MFINIKLITVILSLILAGAIFFFLILPQWGEIQSARDELRKTESRLEEVKNRIAEFDRLNRKYTESAQKAENMRYILPKNKEISELLVELQQLAIINGVNMVSVNVAGGGGQGIQREIFSEGGIQEVTESASAPQILGISLSLAGSYDNFKKYLDSVEKNIRLIDVNSVSFGASGEGDLYSYSVSAQAYFLPAVK